MWLSLHSILRRDNPERQGQSLAVLVRTSNKGSPISKAPVKGKRTLFANNGGQILYWAYGDQQARQLPVVELSRDSGTRLYAAFSDRGLGTGPVWPTACDRSAEVPGLCWRGDRPWFTLGVCPRTSTARKQAVHRTPGAWAPGQASTERDSPAAAVCGTTDAKPAVLCLFPD